MKLSSFLPFFFLLFFSYITNSHAKTLKNDFQSPTYSIALLISDENNTAALLNNAFIQHFDNYDEQSYIRSTDDQTLQAGIKQFIDNKVNDQTLVTVYYRGKGVYEKENLMKNNSVVANSGLSLQKELIEPILAKNPQGLFVFYDAQKSVKNREAFIPADIPNAAVFYPKQHLKTDDNPTLLANELIKALGQEHHAVSLEDLSHLLSRSTQLRDQLDYQRFDTYCLFPMPTGCAENSTPPSLDENLTTTSLPTKTSCQTAVQNREIAPAVVRLGVDSPCRANSLVSIRYQQYDYRIQLDANGRGQAFIFLISQSDTATIEFDDGDSITRELNTLSLPSLDRVILSYDGAEQLDLHALEFGAALNSPQDIWRETSCQGEVSLNQNSYLYCFKGAGDNAMNLQVYNRKRESTDTQTGIIDFRVDYFSRGSVPTAPYCGANEQSSIAFKTQRIILGQLERPKQYYIASRACGALIDERTRYIRDSAASIQIR